MAHDHSHEDPKAYYVEQLCMIGIGGALGGIAIMLKLSGSLWFLIPSFQTMVMAGGIGLLAVVVIRAAVVWLQAGRTPAGADKHEHAHEHEHEHEENAAIAGTALATHAHDHGDEPCHGAACDHDHDHAHGHGHGEGDGHEHGWAPWRYVILLLPVVLYFLGLPNKGMQQLDASEANVQTEGVQVQDVADRNGGQPPFEVGFKELERAPYTPEGRQLYEGKTIYLVGQYLAGPNNKVCTLGRVKISCCAADAVQLNAVIMIDPKASSDALLPDGLRGKWVRVEGQVQFQRRPDRPDAWMTVVVLRPGAERPISDLVKVVKPDESYYLY